MPPFALTPYDGSARPFAIGLAPLDPSRWIEPDERMADDLAAKEALFASRFDDVFAAEPDTGESQREVLEALVAHLCDRHPDVWRPMAEGISVVPAGRVVPLGEGPPLLAAARLVQDDLVLMRRGGDGWRLAAAALCAPSSWSLREKFCRSLDAIHDRVPGYPAMAPRMARIFDNLRVGIPVWRLNWSIYPDAVLYHPAPERLAPDWRRRPEVGAFVRVERQTLTRMPESGDILFTIKVMVDPVAALREHPDGARLAAGLRDQLLGLDADQLAYKGLAAHRDALAGWLGEIAAGA